METMWVQFTTQKELNSKRDYFEILSGAADTQNGILAIYTKETGRVSKRRFYITPKILDMTKKRFGEENVKITGSKDKSVPEEKILYADAFDAVSRMAERIVMKNNMDQNIICGECRKALEEMAENIIT